MLQGRLTYGGALSGRDQNAVNKTISGLLKLIHPSPEEPVPDEDLEWAVRLALECRRRVKEQQKRIGTAEFRNTQFSYTLGQDGVEKFVVTPELQSEDQHRPRSARRPARSGRSAPAVRTRAPGCYRIEVTEGPGSGVRILNRPAPPAFAESSQVRRGRTSTRGPPNLSATATPASTSSRSSCEPSTPARAAVRSAWPPSWRCARALLNKSLRGGLVVVGGLNLGGSIDPLHNAIDVVELAVEKGASVVLMPVSSRKQLFDLSDDMATKVTVVFYSDAREAFIKAIAD